MALGVPAKDVVEHYGDDPMNQELLTKALTECGILWNQFTCGTMLYVGWYFAVVPSLNKRGANHQVLLHWDGNGKITVLDPAIGDRYAQDGSDLRGWEALTPFLPGGTLPVRRSHNLYEKHGLNPHHPVECPGLQR